VTVNDHLAVANPEQISERPTVVPVIALRLGDALAGVFQDARAFGNILQRETSGSVNVRGTNDEAQQEDRSPQGVLAV
jgi:hypothetical protein